MEKLIKMKKRLKKLIKMKKILQNEK